MSLNRKALAAGLLSAVALVAVAVPGAALADTASTQVGTLTATQQTVYPCDDLGARVDVTITNGLPNTQYSLTESGYWHATGTITTNAAGSGSTYLAPVSPPGLTFSGDYATVTATANGKSGQVRVFVYCQSSKGD